jgi:N-acetyldiaminopimelate deacetylase
VTSPRGSGTPAPDDPGALDLPGIRRALHRIPELAFEETRTSEFVHDVISGLVTASGRAGVEVRRHRTGIIVHVPGTGAGRAIGWRSDMDALPVAERTGLPFASQREGVAHACGHDVHMTIGLGLLERILGGPRRGLDYVFLFQPAEEHLSGAAEFWDSGLLGEYGIDEFYALHVSPEYAPGVIATRPGTLFAGSASVTVEFTGVPGHAAMPHRAVDPIVSVASFVMNVQSLVSRSTDPAAGGLVLTFGTISGGTVVNGIAGSAKVMGTLRFLNEEQHDLAFRRIREIAAGSATATGATADVWLEDSPWIPVINDATITERFISYLRGRDGVAWQEAPVTMTSEDFGYLLARIPGMMFWLGTGGDHPLHSGQFAPPVAIIEPAVNLIADYLAQL